MKYTVAIAESDQQTRNNLTSLVKKYNPGVTILGYETAQPLIERAKVGDLSLILLDGCTECSMRGPAATRMIRANGQESVPIYVMSSQNPERSRIAAQGAGANGFIAKDKYFEREVMKVLKNHLPGRD